MSLSPEARELAERRGIILIALDEQYPRGLLYRALANRVIPAYASEGDPKKAVARDLAYLEGRGLIAHAEETVTDKVYLTYTLTPDGADVVSGHRNEAAIIVAKGL